MSCSVSTSPNDWPEKLDKMRILDGLLRCSICFEYFDIAVMVPSCSHNYCSLCIRKYLLYKKECPTCRVTFTEHELKNNKVVDIILQTYLAVRSELLELVKKGLGAEKPTTIEPPKNKQCVVSEPDTSTQPTVKHRKRKSPTPEKQDPALPTVPSESPVQCPEKRACHGEQGVTPEPLKSPTENMPSPYFSSPSTSASSKTHATTPKSRRSTDEKYAECPVCSEMIAERKINHHLDICLTRGDKKESLRQPKEKSSSTDNPPGSPENTQVKGKKLSFLRLGRKGKLLAKSTEPPAAEPIKVSTQKNTLDNMLSPRRKPAERQSDSEAQGLSSGTESEHALGSDSEVLAANALIPSSSQKHRPKPKVEYNLLNDKQIKQLLKSCNLSTVGTRQALINRHKEFLFLYNSQCDVPNPKSAEAVAKMVEKQENLKERLASKNETLKVSKHQSEEEIENFRQNYAKAHQSQFDMLMKQARENAKRKRKQKTQVEENDTPSSSSNIEPSEAPKTESSSTNTTKQADSVDSVSVVDDSASESSERTNKLLPDIDLAIPAVQEEHDKKVNQELLRGVNETIDEFNWDDGCSEDMFGDNDSVHSNESESLLGSVDVAEPQTGSDMGAQVPAAPSVEGLEFGTPQDEEMETVEPNQEAEASKVEVAAVTETQRSPAVKVRRSKRKLYESNDDDSQDCPAQRSRRLRARHK